MVVVFLVAVPRRAMPVRFPVLELAAREDRHIALGHAQELLEHCPSLRKQTGPGVACGEPAPNLIDRVANFLERSDSFLVPMRREIGDAFDPWRPAIVKWVVALGNVKLLNGRIRSSHGAEKKTVYTLRLGIVRVQSDGLLKFRSCLIVFTSI